ncbi:CASPA protein, partial [Pheucticus melanocephalus]|nr:CASPA protein [Pheucticus melanocephalus]
LSAFRQREAVSAVGSSNMENDISLKFHQQLFLISENLVTEDVAALKFLCTDLLHLSKLEGVKSAADIFKLLMAQEYLNVEDTFLLAELLYRIKCHSLLEKLGYTKEKVQERLGEKGRISPYRQMLYELSENITSEMLKEITFLLQDHLPKRWMILSALDLLTLLEKQGLLTKHNVKILEDVCVTVSPDLLEKIDLYKKGKVLYCNIFSKPDVHTAAKLLKELGVLPSFCPTKIHKRRCVMLSGVEEGTPVDGVFYSKVGLKYMVLEVLVIFSFKNTMKSYKMDGPHRGFCLIINNVNFNSSQRKGSCKDAEQLERVFTWLGLDVRTYTDLTSGEIINLMETWQRVPDHKDRNCFICCILSHGKSGAIFGTDYRLVSIRVLTSHFTAKQCPQLAAKPKLFFIQACQGDNIQCPVYVDTDGPTPDLSSMQERVFLSESIPEEADFLLGMATVDGYVSFRHMEEGSWYIQALCSKLQLLVPRGEDILSILTQVNEDVARRNSPSGTKKQMPQPAYTLRRKFIFPIPITPPPS